MAADGRRRDFSRMELSPEEIVKDPDRELPYEQSVSGPTGNEGISVERWYRQADVVLWPRSNYVALLAREGPAFAVPALAEKIQASDDPSAEPELLSFAAAILDNWGRRTGFTSFSSRPDWFVIQMLECQTHLADAELAGRFIREIHAAKDSSKDAAKGGTKGAANDTALYAEHANLESDPAVRLLREHVVAELRAATVSRPTEPTDWHQDVELRHYCADCLELAEFARDPEAQVHRFKAGKDRRHHLHQQIDGLKLDMTHVTEREGRPFTLVCTKTRGAYVRAVARYVGDLRSLKALGVGGAAAAAKEEMGAGRWRGRRGRSHGGLTTPHSQ